MTIEFDLGFKCNLKCSYCVIKGKPINKESIDKFINWMTKKDDIIVDTIRFIGGEPSLHIKTMKYIISKIHTKIDSIHLITNGTMIEDLIEFSKFIFNEYKVLSYITISMDRLGFDNQRKVNNDSIINFLISNEEDILQNNISIDINRVISNQTESELDMFNTIIYTISCITRINNLKLMDENGLISGESFTYNCNLACKETLLVREDKIYLCKLLHTFHNLGFISSIDDVSLYDLFNDNKRSNIKKCMFDSVGRCKHENNKRI